ncbi:glycosyltransferase [Myroides sp. LJL119]
MQKEKKLAVILSLYKNDRIDYLRKAILSLLEQTFSDFDLYVQCDGEVRKECLDFLKNIRDSRVILREREENRGLAFSLNELLSVVLVQDYLYIARMDADDISMPNRFERQIEFLDSNIEVDCLGTWAIEIDSSDREYFKKEMPVTHKACLELFKKRDCLIHPTVMFRNSYFQKAGLYPLDTYFGEDTIMWMQGFNSGCKFANLDDFLFKFRLDDDFFERRRGMKHARSIINLRRRVNKTLGFGFVADGYMYLYAFAKLMPTPILNLIYKVFR